VAHTAVAVCLVFLLELVALRYLGDLVTGALLGAVEREPGLKLIVYPLIAPGVALHEAGHLLAALATGAGVVRFSLFNPRRTEGGRVILGYVQQRYVPRLPGGQALIALAPLLAPPLILYGLAPLIWDLHGLASPQQIFTALSAHLANPWTWAWLWLFVSMTLSNFPSDEDFRTLGPLWIPFVAVLLALPVLATLVAPGVAPGIAHLYLTLAVFLAPSLVVCGVLSATFLILRR
jgi:hypothetical protein